MATIRIAAMEDVPRILELYDQLSLDGSPEKKSDGAPDRYSAAFSELEALPGCELIVAEEEARIIGTLMYNIIPSLGHGGRPWAIVENVVVDETLRGTGIGKLLMEYVRKKAKAAGCYKIQLMSDKRRTEAHKFYHAIGYNATAEGFRTYL